nr:hypothetical protein [Sphingomonas sp. BT553]
MSDHDDTDHRSAVIDDRIIGRIDPDRAIAMVATLILAEDGMAAAQPSPGLPGILTFRGFPDIIMRHAQNGIPAPIQHAQHSIVHIDDPSVRREGHHCLRALNGIPYSVGNDMIGVGRSNHVVQVAKDYIMARKLRGGYPVFLPDDGMTG